MVRVRHREAIHHVDELPGQTTKLPGILTVAEKKALTGAQRDKVKVGSFSCSCFSRHQYQETVSSCLS